MLPKRALLIGLILCAGPAVANAGWVIEQSSTFTSNKGQENAAEPSTTRVSQGRLRVTQPNSTTIQDCVKGRFTVYVPERNAYWTGTFDDYVAQTAAARAAAERNPFGGSGPKDEKPKDQNKVPQIDEAKLPKIEIRKSDQTVKVAGYDTVKHVIESNGQVFQEVWMTTAFNVNDDLDPKQYVRCKARLAAGMRGKAGLDFNALYRSKEYLDLSESGFPMKTVIRHIGGTYVTEVLSIRRSEVPDSDFAIPQGARKVALTELFGPPPGP